jgi:hypothetical protein
MRKSDCEDVAFGPLRDVIPARFVDDEVLNGEKPLNRKYQRTSVS